jgi:hypothetical protein
MILVTKNFVGRCLRRILVHTAYNYHDVMLHESLNSIAPQTILIHVVKNLTVVFTHLYLSNSLVTGMYMRRCA